MDNWISPKWSDRVIIPLLLLLVSCFFVGNNVVKHTQISPIDEYVYLDYTARVFEVGMLPQGSQTGDIARNYISCLGVAGYGDFNPGACNSGNYTENDKYPYSGKSSADIYPPLYFWVASSFGYAISTIFSIDFLSAARLSGILWISAAAILLFGALRKLQISRTMASSVSIIMICSIPSWWSNTFISTDASAMFAGSLVFYSFISYFQGKWKPWHLILMSVMLTLLKFQNIMVLGFLALMVLFTPKIKELIPTNHGNSLIKPQKAVITAIGIVLSAVIAQLTFLFIRKVMAAGPIAQQGVVGDFGLNALLSETTKFINGITWGSSTIQTLPTIAVVVAVVTTWFIIGGTVAATISEPKQGLRSTLGIVWIAVAVISAPLLGIAIQVMAGPYFSLPARYGLSLFPIGLAISALALDVSKIWKVFTAVFAIYCFVVIAFGAVSQTNVPL